MPPKYKVLQLNNDQIKQSLHLQVLAHHRPKLINWPPEPWNPINSLDKILKNIRNNGSNC